MTRLEHNLQALRATHPELAQQVSSLRNLEQILHWLTASQYDWRQLDLVAMDEFSHDLLLPLMAGVGVLSFALT